MSGASKIKALLSLSLYKEANIATAH